MRSLKWLNVVLLVGLLLSACATSTPATEEQGPVVGTDVAPAPTAAPKPSESAETGGPAEAESRFHESPMLTERVHAGELPPVEDRLPANPMIIEPLGEVGHYGGELRVGFTGDPAWGGLLYIAGWEHPVNWKADFSSFEENIIEHWEANDTATEFTWYLRKGLKWSNGDPYNADDVMFYIDDVLLNEELNPGGPSDFLPEEHAEGFSAEKIDDYTVRFLFGKPYGTFMMSLATWQGQFFDQYPDEYLKQFHADYNPDIDDLVAADDQAEDWVALFWSKSPGGSPAFVISTPELPSLGPWVVTQPLGAGTELIMERNPYYWKVDTAGNQLPYIDRIVATQFQDDESRTLAMMNGDLDWIYGAGDGNRELYFDAVDEGKPIEIRLPQDDQGNMQSIHFNLTAEDPIKNEVFNNKDFRIGMSHAINRSEIIEVVFKGQGEPAQVCPMQSSPLFVEQLCNQYIEFDLDLANEYLDKVLPEKDAEGYRLGPDGKRFNPVFTVANDNPAGQHWVAVAEMLIEHWKKVGVEVLLESVSGTIVADRWQTNPNEMFLFHGGEGGSGMTAILDPRWHVPGTNAGFFDQGWKLWLMDPEDPHGVEPPDYVMEVRSMYLTATQQPTEAGQIEWMRKVMEKSAEHFWMLGITRAGTTIQPVSSRLGNIPDSWMVGWVQGFSKIIHPEQWYIER